MEDTNSSYFTKNICITIASYVELDPDDLYIITEAFERTATLLSKYGKEDSILSSAIVALHKLGKLLAPKNRNVISDTLHRLTDFIMSLDHDREIRKNAMQTVLDLDKPEEVEKECNEIFEIAFHIFDGHDRNAKREALYIITELAIKRKDKMTCDRILKRLIRPRQEESKTSVLEFITKLIRAPEHDIALGDDCQIKRDVIKSIKGLFNTGTQNSKIFETVFEALVHLFNDESSVIRSEAKIALTEINLPQEVQKDRTMAKKLLMQVIDLITDDNEEVRRKACNWMHLLYFKEREETYLIRVSLVQVMNNLSHNNNLNIRRDIITAVSGLSEHEIKDKKFLGEITNIIATLIDDDSLDGNLRSYAVWAASLLAIETHDGEIISQVLQRIVNYYLRSNVNIDRHKLHILINHVNKEPEGQTALLSILEQLLHFLSLRKNEDKRLRTLVVILVGELVESKIIPIDDKQKRHDIFEIILRHLDHNNQYITVESLKIISYLVQTGIKDNQILDDGFTQINSLLKHLYEAISQPRIETQKQNLDISFGNNYEDIIRNCVMVLHAIAIIKNEKDKSIIALDQAIKHFCDGTYKNSNSHLKETIIDLTIALKDRNKAIEAIAKVTQKKCNLEVPSVSLGIVSELMAKSLVRAKDLVGYLHHENGILRDNLEKELLYSFKILIDQLNDIDTFLKDSNNLNVQAFRAKSFFNTLEETTKDKIARIIQSILEKDDKNSPTLNQPVRIRVANIRLAQILFSQFNHLGHKKPYKLIETSLAIIGYEQPVNQSTSKKKLVEYANKFLKLKLNFLEDQELEWIDQKFQYLASLSQESRRFFRRLCRKLLEDFVITDKKEKLIIKLINHGFTTSITRSSDIIFKNRRYRIETTCPMRLQEKIAKIVLKQEKDLLIFQYSNYQPFFPKSIKTGMKKAAADIEVVGSLVQKYQTLVNDKWLFTFLKADDGRVIMLLEQRSVHGDHIIYKLNEWKKYVVVHPEDIKAELHELFGIYQTGKEIYMYQGGCKVLDHSKGIQIIRGIAMLDPILNQIELTKVYFQQELLGLGNTDRLDFLSNQLEEKLTDYSKHVLHPSYKYTPQEMASIKDYYNSFIGTLEMMYQASNAINSGCLALEGSDIRTSILSMLVSLAPYVGDILSRAVDSLGEFIKTREVINNARRIKALSPDGVGLNQLAGEIICKVIHFEAKHHQILKITEKGLEKMPENQLDKLKAFFSKIGNKIDDFLYSNNEKSLQAKLGQDDASKLIAYWLNHIINLDILEKKALEILAPK